MIDPSRLRPVPQDQIARTAAPLAQKGPTAAYVDRAKGLCVQIWDDATPGCLGTPWEGTLRVSIKHTRAKTAEQACKRGYALPLTWDDLQAIKDYFWPGRIGLEIFPPRDSIVDVADMRWLWILPAGACLPFNLKSSSTELLRS